MAVFGAASTGNANKVAHEVRRVEADSNQGYAASVWGTIRI